MGLFWDYFKKKLRFPLIWKPGPLAQVAKGGAEVLDQAREDALWLREQFLPVLCDDAYLENFARSRGIVRSALEPEAYYIGRVRFAYLWFILGGKDEGMEKTILNYFDLDEVSVKNLRDEDPDRWAEFQVVLDGIKSNLLNELDQVEWAVNKIKPARSKLAGFDLWITFPKSDLHEGIGMFSGHDITVYPAGAGEMDFNLETGQFAACFGGHHVVVYPAA